MPTQNKEVLRPTIWAGWGVAAARRSTRFVGADSSGARDTQTRVFARRASGVLSHTAVAQSEPSASPPPAPIPSSGVVRRLLVERFRFGLLRSIEHISHIQLLASGLNPDCDAPNSAGMSALTPVRDATLVFARPGARNAA